MSANGEILTLIKRELYQDKLIIRASDGKLTFANSEHLFGLGVSSEFKEWELTNQSIPALKMEVDEYHLNGGATFEEMFGFFGVSLERLWFTKNQVIDFRINNYKPSDAHDETFILVKKDELQPATLENLFVISLYVHGDDVGAAVSRFDDIRSWITSRTSRSVIIPKLPE